MVEVLVEVDDGSDVEKEYECVIGCDLVENVKWGSVFNIYGWSGIRRWGLC
jgi:hypothetical protein